MKNKTNGFKEELKYWLPIIAIIVSSAVAFTTLKGRVNAVVSQVRTNEESLKEFVEKTSRKLDIIIGNQIKIAAELGVEIERE